MIPHDYHMHTSFSCDCETDMMEMCRAAIARDLPEIGFTEHYDLTPVDPCFDFFRTDEWWTAIEGCRAEFAGSLVIRAGVELGEPHQYASEMQRFLSAYPWDYSLGSLHWVNERLVFDPAFFRESGTDPYRDYFEELARMARTGPFDILAHMDVVKRYGSIYFGRLDPKLYEKQIRAVLRACASRGIGMEINTSPLRREVRETSPTEVIFKWFLEEGGRWVTLGSDAHSPDEIGFGLDKALMALKRAGVQHVARFERRQAQALPMEVE